MFDPQVPLARRGRERRREGRALRAEARRSGVWYPRWLWPSFAAPATLWLILFFVLPFYVVVSVAFGTIDYFRNPLPVYEPWYWSFSSFTNVVGRFAGAQAFYRPAFIRTLIFVPAASLICLVIGFGIAYYAARWAGKTKGLFLLLLIAPFWISYLMRIYAWEGLLQQDGWINKALVFLHITQTPINWLQGRPITVILGLVYGYMPYMILPLYGQLDRIDPHLLEAGRDLGASPARTFLRVTLPLSRQAILAGLVIVGLPMFGDYFTNDLLSTARTAMFGNLIDNAVQNPGEGPQAGSLVLLLTALLLIPMIYYMRSSRRLGERSS